MSSLWTSAARGWRRAGAIGVAWMVAVGCGSVPDRNPVPPELVDVAEIRGIPYARFWGDGLPRDYDERLEKLRKKRAAGELDDVERSGSYLAISGGGAYGAYGAGLLVGWTRAGNRPNFDIVTGISTGALIAPFAFLGSEYDDKLELVYKNTETKDLLEPKGRLEGLTSDSLVTTKGLRKMIAEHVTEVEVAAIAAEWRKGRSLLIGTTNLDAGRPVVWSLGEIAASGQPGALDMIRDILLASAAIPVAFPPVYFEVEANGEVYDELHVDGGAAAQVFLYPAALDFRELVEVVGKDPDKNHNVYVIRNSKLISEFAAVDPPGIGGISARTLSVLFNTQGTGDLFRIYVGAQRDGLQFHLAHIPDDFDAEPQEAFDPEFMRALFDLGYQSAVGGYPWKNAPPGMEPPAPPATR